MPKRRPDQNPAKREAMRPSEVRDRQLETKSLRLSRRVHRGWDHPANQFRHVGQELF
jgi:hypothetical protein